MGHLPHTFRISVWRPWLLAICMLAVPASIVAVASLAAGQPGVSAVSVIALAGVALFLWVVIGLAAATSRWDVDAEGIGGPDNWHIHRWVRWDEIESISRLPVPGYPFVWVNTPYRRKYFWVPLFFSDMPGFRKAVRHYAGADHPLRRLLDEESHEKARRHKAED